MKLFYEKYIKLEHIGRGANADVFKVKHAEWGDVRAIKVLNNYIESKSDRAYESFLKECKTLLAIGSGQNPNILRIYGADLINNHAILEMDYVQGKSLYSYVKEKGFFDYEEVESFIHDIVGALAYTHHDIYKFLMDPEVDNLQPDPNDGHKYILSSEKEAELVKKYGIAHNDLHSNNVMRRDYDGRFILLDFGLAVQDGKCVKSSRMADGNPEYQAPEKFNSETVDTRSDVYSLGVLIYELLAGHVPFPLEYDEEGKISYRAQNKVLTRHLTETPPAILPLRQVAYEHTHPGEVYERDYPEWLDEVVMKCLAKNPAERYADAKELLDIINSYQPTEHHNSYDVSELKAQLDNLRKAYEDQKSCVASFYDNWQATRFTLNDCEIRLSKEIEEKRRLLTEIKQLRSNSVAKGGKSPVKTIALILISFFLLCALTWALYLDDSYDRLKHRFYNAYENAVKSNAYDPEMLSTYPSPRDSGAGGRTWIA